MYFLKNIDIQILRQPTKQPGHGLSSSVQAANSEETSDARPLRFSVLKSKYVPLQRARRLGTMQLKFFLGKRAGSLLQWDDCDSNRLVTVTSFSSIF